MISVQLQKSMIKIINANLLHSKQRQLKRSELIYKILTIKVNRLKALT